jgi:hypothetical protein
VAGRTDPFVEKLRALFLAPFDGVEIDAGAMLAFAVITPGFTYAIAGANILSRIVSGSPGSLAEKHEGTAGSLAITGGSPGSLGSLTKRGGLGGIDATHHGFLPA